MGIKSSSSTHSQNTAKKAVVAIGGNAILENGLPGTYEEQGRNIVKTARKIVSIMKNAHGFEIVALTHGNGPQVGYLDLQQDIASAIVPRQPMHVLIAMTQGQLGYMIQQALQNELMNAKIRKPVASIVTQTVVDKNDPEFSKNIPSKPIGPLYTQEEAKEIAERNQYIITKVKPVGDRIWRRVVPSPLPMRIVESDVVRRLVDQGYLVVASGGGGIPVIEVGTVFQGVDGVIDKDLVAGLLGRSVGASILLILTDIDRVKLNFGKPDETSLSEMSLEEAERHLKDGQFADGSMAPKIVSSIEFLKNGGESAIITSIDNAINALHGKAGTRIVKNRS